MYPKAQSIHGHIDMGKEGNLAMIPYSCPHFIRDTIIKLLQVIFKSYPLSHSEKKADAQLKRDGLLRIDKNEYRKSVRKCMCTAKLHKAWSGQ